MRRRRQQHEAVAGFHRRWWPGAWARPGPGRSRGRGRDRSSRATSRATSRRQLASIHRRRIEAEHEATAEGRCDVDSKAEFAGPSTMPRRTGALPPSASSIVAGKPITWRPNTRTSTQRLHLCMSLLCSIKLHTGHQTPCIHVIMLLIYHRTGAGDCERCFSSTSSLESRLPSSLPQLRKFCPA